MMNVKKLTKASILIGATALSSTAFAGLSGIINDTEWRVGGFVELETTVQDTEGAGSVSDMTARRTRVDLRTSTDTPEGKATGRLEFDFAGKTQDKDLVPRIRHAVINWNGWTFGQTLSTFSNFEAYHKSVDDAMPAPLVPSTGYIHSSNPLERNPQIAYGQKFGEGFSYKIAVEKADKPLRTESSTDFFYAGRLAYNNKGPFAGSIALASYKDSSDEDQWRAVLGARYQLGKVSFRLGHNYDDGVDGTVTSGSVRYNFDKNNWVSAIHEHAEIDGPIGTGEGDRSYLNYYRQLTKTVQVGFEYMDFNGSTTEYNTYRVDIKKTF